MKTKRRIRARDDDVEVTVVIEVKSNGALTRGEHNQLREELASNVMAAIPGAPYINVKLSQIRCERAYTRRGK